MCYLVRHEAAEERPAAAPVAGPHRGRARWAGVAAGIAVAGLALAALVAPSPTSPLSGSKAAPAVVAHTPAVPAAPTVERFTTVIGGGAMERTALPADDGVPTPDVARAGLAPCHEGL